MVKTKLTRAPKRSPRRAQRVDRAPLRMASRPAWSRKLFAWRKRQPHERGREGRCLSQAGAAKRLGVSQPTYAMWETGLRSPRWERNIARIRKVTKAIVNYDKSTPRSAPKPAKRKPASKPATKRAPKAKSAKLPTVSDRMMGAPMRMVVGNPMDLE